MKTAPWTELEESIDVYGFVVGQSRDEAEIQPLSHALAGVFPKSVQPITSLLGIGPFGTESYLMSPQDEGICQVGGSRIVYQQDPGKNFLPIASLRIGLKTTQWAQYDAEAFTFLGGINSLGQMIVQSYRFNPDQFQALCGPFFSFVLSLFCPRAGSRRGRQSSEHRSSIGQLIWEKLLPFLFLVN